MDFKFGIHKGDRVRVSAEGIVKRAAASGGEYLVESDVLSADTWVHFTAVEKIAPPLPTTPGSVIRHGGTTYLLASIESSDTTRPLWVFDGASDGYSADYFAKHVVGSGTFEVIFDAGAK